MKTNIQTLHNLVSTQTLNTNKPNYSTTEEDSESLEITDEEDDHHWTQHIVLGGEPKKMDLQMRGKLIQVWLPMRNDFYLRDWLPSVDATGCSLEEVNILRTWTAPLVNVNSKDSLWSKKARKILNVDRIEA